MSTGRPISVGHRRLALHASKTIKESLEKIRRDFKGENNSPANRNAMVTRIAQTLSQLKVQQVFEDFQVVDETSPQDVQQGIIRMKTLLKPAASMDFIKLDIQVMEDNELEEIARIIEEALGEEIFERRED